MLIKPLIALALALPLAGAGALASLTWVVVDVKDGDAGHHLVVPVPLFAAEAALAFAPGHARSFPCPELARHLPEARAALHALAAAADRELVRVETRDEHVSVRKEAGTLVVDVVARGAQTVHVAVPLATAEQALAAFDGERFDTGRVVAALGQARGPLVHVHDRASEVEVRVW